MIFNLTLNDKTQKRILKELKITEKMLEQVTDSKVNIHVMPDLGIPHNIYRIKDGFYTGMAVDFKDSSKPIIPIGTTVNVCGVGIYKLNKNITISDFNERVKKIFNTKHDPFYWNNYTRGNHFVSLMYSEGDDYLKKGQYLVIHASANEYKDKLYPYPGVWYEKKIKTLVNPKYPNRILHYIDGSTAEEFYSIVKDLHEFNYNRNISFAKEVLKELYEKEILTVNHYGMPNDKTICIGCQWETKSLVPLLSAPGEDIYIISPNNKTKYFPHGFGLKLPKNSNLSYVEDGILIGNKKFVPGESIDIGKDAIPRLNCSNSSDLIGKLLEKTPGKIVSRLHQIASFSSRGFEIWKKEI